MSEFAVKGPELKKLVRLARESALPFAFNPGKTEDEHYFALHRKRPARALGKAAKDEGAGTKAAFGTCKIEGKVMQLRCEVVVMGMAKSLKKFLKANKVNLNVEIMDSDGQVLESDIEDLPDDPDQSDDAPANEAPAAQISVADLVARLKIAQQRIVAAPPPVAEKLNQVIKKVVVGIKEQKLDEAAKSLAQIEAVLAKLPAAKAPPAPNPQTSNDGAEATADVGPNAATVMSDLRTLAKDAQALPDPMKAKVIKPIQQLGALVKAGEIERAADGFVKVRKVVDALGQQAAAAQQAASPAEAAPEPIPEPPQQSEPEAVQEQPELDSAEARWQEAYATLKPSADAAISEHRFASEAEEDTFKARLRYAEANASENSAEGFEAALKSVPGLLAMLDAAAKNPEGMSKPDIGDDVQPFANSRLKWAQTRATMHSELKKLQDAISTACKDDPDLVDMAGMVTDLDNYLKGLDARLEDRLDDVVNAAQGEEREEKKGVARDLLAEYQKELQSDFFSDVDGNNGFVTISVASTANAALAEISDVLKPSAAA
jgi:hypothetical protein